MRFHVIFGLKRPKGEGNLGKLCCCCLDGYSRVVAAGALARLTYKMVVWLESSSSTLQSRLLCQGSELQRLLSLSRLASTLGWWPHRSSF
jgi:hypothetical protein